MSIFAISHWDAEYIEYMSSTTLKCFQDGPFPQETCSKLHPAENWNPKLLWPPDMKSSIILGNLNLLDAKKCCKTAIGVIKSSKIVSSPMGHIGIF
jgi:hypothetical protein